MFSTIAFLQRLLHQGEAVMHGEPVFAAESRPGVLRLLETAYAEHRLHVAGPLVPFDPETALAAAQFLSRACWQLVTGDGGPTNAEQALGCPENPGDPAAHLSADLCLRLLGTVYRRVRIRPPEDALHKPVVDVLCRWPLSGAATDVAEQPVSTLEFGHHH